MSAMCEQENRGRESSVGRVVTHCPSSAQQGTKTPDLASSELMWTINPDCRI